MFFKLFFAWIGGILTAEAVILIAMFLIKIYYDRRKDRPLTKDEWKVM